ncbi:hypothetical protein J8J14_03435 [Roseomonas sp. SSH11]|uniref:ZIP Zinc transporter n=1 Tax=Pararoseomonas baculiformis TaxID=2820812 RepID=A0ABS4AA18_9PROT|nr:hypothetical protein [Pararoseomonas baculiformis]MBP0443823.1 hypothetical protein [Pararoseomonas baculiformis]
MSLPLLAFAIACGLAAVHLFVGAMRFLDGVPRSRWLSAAGGASTAYIFLHLLPDLAAAHHRDGAESEVRYFLIALAGLVAFYGVERRVRLSRKETEEEEHGPGVFWLHVGSFATYSLIIGYLLLHREESGTLSLLLYGGAMALHFLSSDYGMRLEHRDRYDRTARWVLAAGVMLGWLIGWLVEIPRPMVDALFAFLAGGVVLNVMKEELPEERKSRFGAFVFGATIYGALLVAVQ